MKKLAVTFVILLCMFFNTVVSASVILEYDGSVHNYTGSVFTLAVNGRNLTNLPLQPIIFNGRSLVPVREVFEALGATVDYIADSRKVKIVYNGDTVELKIGSTTAKINGKDTEIPDGVSPKLIAKWGESAKTMVPVRFISESLNMKVDFDSSKDLINITTSTASATPSSTPAPTSTATPQAKLNKIKYSQDGDVVTVTVSANRAISSISKASKTAAGVVYVDVENASYTTENKTEVNLGPVLAVRVGIHDNNTRIAIDTENMKNYSVSLSDDAQSVIFRISSGDTPLPTVTPTKTPAPTSSPTQSPEATTAPAKNPLDSWTPPKNGQKIVVIDAGHGGSDPGAARPLMTEEEMQAFKAALDTTEPILATMPAGSGKKCNEKDIALAVATKVKQNLESNGITVIMTRTGDTYPSLDERPALANKSGAALFLSIHLNSTTADVTAANGMEIYYCETNNSDTFGITSKEMASEILKSATSASGVKSRGVKAANHAVTRGSAMPANLIEIGFINNPQELENLSSSAQQDKIAQGIANGIISVLGKITLPKK